MKSPFRHLLVLPAALLSLAAGNYEPRDGDIVFQDSQAPESLAIQMATDSPYSHVGIVVVRDGEPVVWEAVNPVTATPFAQWVARGREGHFVAKRLVDAGELLGDEGARRLQQTLEDFAGRPYDFRFSWSSDAIYCSELVWKSYDKALGIRLSTPRRMGDYDLSHPAVREQLGERFGDAVPLDAPVVSPAALFDSPRLRKVHEP
ncbi:YiiX family permuted papain-like enzyme [Thioalkalivibrio thiocyanodenitrificans]|uniref:YiiX family permuted papain-like enzyme n=1 Tax=Thioalkalivibrio thiocyanodenitrificans TaxID=243063 RepID=UPI00037C6347|nr:YiiX family permuted papain-like enzyme [Thioalkalivibrio thiocyanodenitrificans]